MGIRERKEALEKGPHPIIIEEEFSFWNLLESFPIVSKILCLAPYPNSLLAILDLLDKERFLK